MARVRLPSGLPDRTGVLAIRNVARAARTMLAVAGRGAARVARVPWAILEAVVGAVRVVLAAIRAAGRVVLGAFRAGRRGILAARRATVAAVAVTRRTILAAFAATRRTLARGRQAIGDRRQAAAHAIERTSRILALRIVGAITSARQFVRRTARFVRRAAILSAAVLVVSTVLATAGLATTTLYSQFGAPRVHASAVSWADRTPTYGRVDCRQCHSDESTALAEAKHSSLNCEACHAPTVLHPGTVAGVVTALPIPRSDVCATCHAATAGRPTQFPVIAPAQHYSGADCLRCHDPHTSVAVAPPVVDHPLTNLPACTTCHSPGGLKRYPAGHQPAPDGVGLSCHKQQKDLS